MKKKRKLLILIIILGIIVVVFLLIRSRPSTPVETPPPIPFKLESVFPAQGRHEIVIPNFAIHFNFSKPIDVVSTAIKMEPIVDFEISTDSTGKTLYITPVPEWVFYKEYKITVSTTSKDGQLLDSPIEYLFEPVPLTTSELEQSPQ